MSPMEEFKSMLICVSTDESTEKTHEVDKKPDWLRNFDPDPQPEPRGVSVNDEWFTERLVQSLAMLDQVVEISKDVRSGIPVLKGTRIPISRIFADIADGYSISEIESDLGISAKILAELFDGMGGYVGRPIAKT